MTEIQIPDEARRAGWDAFLAANLAGRDGPQIYAAGIAAAAPLILAAERERILPQIEFLFEHAESFNVPKALRCILAGDWPYPARAGELRVEG